MPPFSRRPGAFLVALFASLALCQQASAHCDTTKGPVVTAAQAALEAGDADLVLHWVRAEDESAVRRVFQHTLEVRALGPAAKELADHYFFETLVRIHRAGEGASYTGLTDDEPEPIIATTDRALDRGSIVELEGDLVSAVRSGLADRFAASSEAKSFRRGDIAGGRAYVAAYVSLTHWVEGVYTAAKGVGKHTAAAPAQDEGIHTAIHPSTGHGDLGAMDTHGESRLEHLPWFLVAILGVAALIEGVFLMRRKRSGPRRPAVPT